MRIELGGGSKPLGGFCNVDAVAGDGVDVVANLELGMPFADDSVDEVYSSHCLEHVRNVTHLLREICRACKLGAKVTIKVPHHGQEMAMCPGHVHVVSEKMVDHFSEFAADWWVGSKRLVLQKKHYTPTAHFHEASRLFPGLSREQIYRFIQNTCHEVIFEFTVENNAH